MITVTMREIRQKNLPEGNFYLYVFWENGIPLYVGMSYDAVGRVLEHDRPGSQWLSPIGKALILPESNGFSVDFYDKADVEAVLGHEWHEFGPNSRSLLHFAEVKLIRKLAPAFNTQNLEDGCNYTKWRRRHPDRRGEEAKRAAANLFHFPF